VKPQIEKFPITLEGVNAAKDKMEKEEVRHKVVLEADLNS